MRNWNKLLVSIMIVIIIIIITGLGIKYMFFSSGNDNAPKMSIKQMYLDSLLQDSLRQDSIRLSTLELSSDEDFGFNCDDSLMKLHDSLIILKYELDICRGVKTLKPVINRNNYQSNKKKEKVIINQEVIREDLVDDDSFVPNTGLSNNYKTEIGGSQYIGLQDGDFYITISDDHFLQYVFSKRLYDEAGGTGQPELNNQGSGKKFKLIGDQYVYTDKTTLANSATLSGIYQWTIFIGNKKGYDAYLPHELIKPQIMQAKGSLAGSITPKDVTEIGKLVPEVKTGRIMPNKVTKTGIDNFVYEGWHFRTGVLYKEVK